MTPAAARRAGFAIALAVPAALMAGALIAEHVFGLFPCEMCWWQRYPHIAAIVLGIGAWVLYRSRAGWTLAMLAALCVLVSGLIGGFHAGVEYKWWEGLTTCATAVKSGGNALDAILNAPMIRCDVPQWTLFGISLAGFNFLIATAAGIAALILLTKGRAA